MFEKCQQWNPVTQEVTLTCKETLIGDLRIWCAAQKKQMMVNYDPMRVVITLKCAGRLEHEKDAIPHIDGYHAGPDWDNRDAHLVWSGETVNVDMLIVGELRMLAGMSRQRKA